MTAAEKKLKRSSRERAPRRPSSLDRVRKEQQRSIDTRERILAAAISEFSHSGFDGTTTREIARAADVAHPLITYHFEGKDGLWRAVIDRTVKSFAESQFERLERLRHHSQTTQLRILFEEFVRHSAQHSETHKLMSRISDSAEQVEESLKLFIEPYFQMIAELISAAQKEGAFISGDPHHLHYMFIGATARIFMVSQEAEKIMGISPHDPAFVEKHLDACLNIFFVNLSDHAE